MYATIKRMLLAALRVPHDPEPPAGSAESIRVFRAGTRLYHWNLFYWGMLQFVAAMGLFWGLVIVANFAGYFPYWLRRASQAVEIFGVAGFVAQLPFTFWKQKLDYEMRWYIVTDRSLRIRTGLWTVQEITMTFANVQKVQLAQGPLQKLLGLATVAVSSAGGGGAAPGEEGKSQKADPHAARFEGVDNAGEIRDLILDRLRRYRDAGLGDTPLEWHSVVDADDSAAAAVLSAAQALRHSIERAR